ncbi:MAG: hypothetical protein IKC61_06170 [Clostridia bacterium]|nr:hypothetical protein [Clostridia bacterium]
MRGVCRERGRAVLVWQYTASGMRSLTRYPAVPQVDIKLRLSTGPKDLQSLPLAWSFAVCEVFAENGAERCSFGNIPQAVCGVWSRCGSVTERLWRY